MLRRYLTLFRVPGVPLLLMAGTAGALPIGMLTLSSVVLVQFQTGSSAAAGVVAATLNAGNAAGLVIQGWLIDKYAQTRVLVIASILCAGSLVALAVAAANNLPLLLVGGLASAAGLTLPPTVTSMRVVVPALIDQADLRTTAYAIIGTVTAVAMVVGPLLVSALLLSGPIMAVLLTGLLAGVSGMVFAATRASRQWRPPPAPINPRPTRLLTPGVVTVLISTLVSGAATGVISVLVPAIMIRQGRVAVSGVFFALVSAGALAAGLVYGATIWRTSLGRQLTLQQIGTAAALVVLAGAVSSPGAMLATAVLFGAFSAPAGIVRSALLDRVAPAGALARAYTTMIASTLIGVAIGSWSGGAVVNVLPDWVVVGATAAAVGSAPGLVDTRG